MGESIINVSPFKYIMNTELSTMLKMVVWLLNNIGKMVINNYSTPF